MIRIEIPQRGMIELKHAVFDINGTLAIEGRPLPEAVGRLKRLAAFLSIHLLTAGTHGRLAEIEQIFGFPLHLVSSGADKLFYVERLEAIHVIAFGNGANDAAMLRQAAIGVAVLTEEGVASVALQAADVLAHGPIEAIDLVLNPKRLVATLRP